MLTVSAKKCKQTERVCHLHSRPIFHLDQMFIAVNLERVELSPFVAHDLAIKYAEKLPTVVLRKLLLIWFLSVSTTEVLLSVGKASWNFPDLVQRGHGATSFQSLKILCWSKEGSGNLEKCSKGMEGSCSEFSQCVRAGFPTGQLTDSLVHRALFFACHFVLAVRKTKHLCWPRSNLEPILRSEFCRRTPQSGVRHRVFEDMRAKL